MSALADALVAAQRRALAATQKAYVAARRLRTEAGRLSNVAAAIADGRPVEAEL